MKLPRTVDEEQIHLVPPLNIRSTVGSKGIPWEYVMVGERYGTYIKMLLDLKHSDRVLDIGCGCGRITRTLWNYIKPPGEYVGYDCHMLLLGWCKANFVTKTNFSFDLFDIHNVTYNPRGKVQLKDFELPYPDGYFNKAFSISIFTHIIPPYDDYPEKIARVIAKGGLFMPSFFFQENEPDFPQEETQNRKNFKDTGKGYWTLNFDQHESGICVKKSDTIALFKKAGFKLLDNRWGGWSGKRDHLENQDFLILEKQ